MIHGRLLPNTHLVALNAKLKLRRERQFINGHPHAKCFTKIVVMHLIVSFFQVRLRKMSIMARVIHMPGKLREGEIPFLVVGRRQIRSTFCKILINNFTFFNGSSFTLAVILIFFDIGQGIILPSFSGFSLPVYDIQFCPIGLFQRHCDNDAQFFSRNQIIAFAYLLQ